MINIDKQCGKRTNSVRKRTFKLLKRITYSYFKNYF